MLKKIFTFLRTLVGAPFAGVVLTTTGDLPAWFSGTRAPTAPAAPPAPKGWEALSPQAAHDLIASWAPDKVDVVEEALPVSAVRAHDEAAEWAASPGVAVGGMLALQETGLKLAKALARACRGCRTPVPEGLQIWQVRPAVNLDGVHTKHPDMLRQIEERYWAGYGHIEVLQKALDEAQLPQAWVEADPTNLYALLGQEACGRTEEADDLGFRMRMDISEFPHEESVFVQRNWILLQLQQWDRLREEDMQQQGIAAEGWVPYPVAETLLRLIKALDARAASQATPTAEHYRSETHGLDLLLFADADGRWLVHVACDDKRDAFVEAISRSNVRVRVGTREREFHAYGDAVSAVTSLDW